MVDSTFSALALPVVWVSNLSAAARLPEIPVGPSSILRAPSCLAVAAARVECKRLIHSTHLRPYPPFKLRVDPMRSAPHRLVDGKFLAMTCASASKSCFPSDGRSRSAKHNCVTNHSVILS